MAQQTYLQLINRVLRNLRKDQVGSVSADAYTLLIGEYVNRAKERVEDCGHQWNSRIFSPTFDCTIGVRTYAIQSPLTLVGGAYTNERSSLVYEPTTGVALSYDITDANAPMRMQEVTEAKRTMLQRALNTTANIPTVFSISNNGASLTVNLLELPSSVRRYTFRCYIPQDELTDASTLLVVPWQPVVFFATAMAAAERGEELGINPAGVLAQGEEALALAVLRDRHQDYLTAYPD